MNHKKFAGQCPVRRNTVRAGSASGRLLKQKANELARSLLSRYLSQGLNGHKRIALSRPARQKSERYPQELLNACVELLRKWRFRVVSYRSRHSTDWMNPRARASRLEWVVHIWG